MLAITEEEAISGFWISSLLLFIPTQFLFHSIPRLSERQITAKDILLYEPGKTYYGYIASATVKQEHAPHFRGLLQSVFDFWCEKYPDIQIEKLYAYAGSEKGWDLIKRLFFAPRYDLGKNAFELDPLARNPSKHIKPFQECLVSKGAKIETPI